MEIMGAIDFGVVIRFSPSDPDCDCSMRLHQGHFLPPSIVCWNCLCQVITEILVLSQAAVSIVIVVVVSAVSDFCFHIDPRNSVFKVVFIFDVPETLIQLFLCLDFVRKFAHITIQFEIEFFFLDLAPDGGRQALSVLDEEIDFIVGASLFSITRRHLFQGILFHDLVVDQMDMEGVSSE